MMNQNQIQNEDYFELLWELEKIHKKSLKESDIYIEENWKILFFEGKTNSEIRRLLLPSVMDWLEVKRIAEVKIRDAEYITQKKIHDPFQKRIAIELLIVSQQSVIKNAEAQLRRLQRYFIRIDDDTKRKDRMQKGRLNADRAKEIPILNVVSKFLELKGSGNRLSCICPFHNEKTPSFFIYVDQNQFHCFGCQEHGDVITFVMKYMRVSFPDAVRYLTSNY